MADFKISINTTKLENIINTAATETAKELDGAFHDAITDDIWPWPYGESPRDIVASGDLRDSQEMVRSDMNFIWRWPVKYSIYVLLGTSNIQGRDWINRGLRETKPFETFSNKVKSKI